MVLIYICIATIFIYFVLFIYIKSIENKININENKIKNLFLERTALIPSVFEISKEYLSMHKDIFHEILNLRKIEFNQTNNNLELYQIIKTKDLINHEINFIFKVCNKHPKLIKEGKFIFLRNLMIKKNDEISKSIKLYSKSITKINRLIYLKNITIFGFIFYTPQKNKI